MRLHLGQVAIQCGLCAGQVEPLVGIMRHTAVRQQVPEAEKRQQAGSYQAFAALDRLVLG
jgi:hypothetical protein